MIREVVSAGTTLSPRALKASALYHKNTKVTYIEHCTIVHVIESLAWGNSTDPLSTAEVSLILWHLSLRLRQAHLEMGQALSDSVGSHW